MPRGTNALMAQWILYILECADGSLYTGITTDLEQRLERHNKGKACIYTRSRKPVKVVYSEVFNSESLVRKREIEIKKLSRTNKLRLIGYFPSPHSTDSKRLGMKFFTKKI
jgi:putative endonuclease